MKYRLGLDLGTNSIGWFITEINESGEFTKLVDGNSRLFHDGRDPKSKTSNAVKRREARGMRRNRDRKLQRMNKLLNYLLKKKVFPSNKTEAEKLKKLDPYTLRSKAIHEKISLNELGRVILHLSKRRGFKSNRKKLEANDSEFKKLQSAFQQKIKDSNYSTLGEFLSNQQVKRNILDANQHPVRTQYKEEFDIIRYVQEKHHSLGDDFWSNCEQIIFFQRPLKDSYDLVGKCPYIENKKRAPKAFVSFQYNRLIESLSNLKIRIDGKLKNLSYEDKNKIFNKLITVEKLSFEKLKDLIDASPDSEFNLESEIRKYLHGDTTSSKLKNKKIFGPNWLKTSVEVRDEIINLLIHEESTDELIMKIQSIWKHELSEEAINNISNVDFSSKLESGYARMSEIALMKINNFMLENNFSFSNTAVKELGFKQEEANDNSNKLPYYGEVLRSEVGTPKDINSVVKQDKYGKISNPTVHIGLNQLRLLINAIIEKYGKPSEITIELARDLKASKKLKLEINRRNKKNKENNDEAIEQLNNLGESVNRENITKYKLWKELGAGHICPYSGKSISLEKLFSRDIEVEHIIPFSRSLDDSFANKTLSFIEMNKIKGNKTPFEAFGHEENYLKNCSNLPSYKKDRFFEDAVEKFLNNENNWLARQLNDTRYLSKIAKKYLGAICPSNKIFVSTGSMTATLRHNLGLNNIFSENGTKREDHRHHAIDAAIQSILNPKLIHVMRNNSEKNFHNNWKEVLKSVFKVKDIRSSLEEILKNKVVSHRVRHKHTGALFNENSFALLKNKVNIESIDHNGKVKTKERNAIIRTNILEISKKKIDDIVDVKLKEKVREIFKNKDKASLQKQLDYLSKENNIKKIKQYASKNPYSIIKHGKENQHEKALKKDVLPYLAVWKLSDNKCEVQEVFLADLYNAKGDLNKIRPHANAKLLFKLYKGDTIFYDSKYFIIKSLNPSNKLIVCTSVNNPAEKEVYPIFSKIIDGKVKKCHIDILGRIRQCL